MKKIGIALLLVLLLLPISILILWFNLDWVATEKNLQKAVSSVNVDLQWKELNIDIQNDGLWGKNISLSASDLCFNSRPLIEMCLSQADVRFHFEVLTARPFFILDQIFLEAFFSHFKMELPPGEEKPAQPFSVPRWTVGSLQDLVAGYLKKAPLAAIEKIAVHLPEALIQVSPQMKVLAQADMVSTDMRIDLKSMVRVLQEDKDFVKVSLDSSLNLQEPLALQGELDLSLAQNPMTHHLSFHWQDFPELKLTSRLPLQMGIIQYDLQAQLKKQEWLLTHQGSMKGKGLPFQEMTLSECTTQISWSEGLPRNLSWPCQVVLSRFKKMPLKGLPSSLHLKMDLQSPLAVTGNVLSLDPSLSIELLETVLADLKAEAQAKIVLDLEQKKLQKMDIQKLDMLLKIPALENIEQLLAQSLWSLPAPVSVLKGPLHLQLTSQSGDILNKNFQVTAQLNTDLTSRRQALKTQTMAQFEVNLNRPMISLQGDMSLQNVRLELPYIGLEAPPQFKPDSRFVKGPPAKPEVAALKKAIFELKDFTIHTNEQPVLLFTRLLPNPIPVNIKYQVKSPMALSGAISLGKMDFEVFKKKAVLERFNVTKYKDSAVQDLDGLITHQTSEVKIEILVIGTTEKPRIEFLSDPPLSRQQIISILLFNKSLQQLADDEKSTAGQLDQALLSEAFGLASLFLLSSTPIESVYFDPATQSYVARVKIDDSTSVSLGSDFDATQQVTLRRRLGGPWSISTALQQSKNSEDIVTTLIEWFRRF